VVRLVSHDPYRRLYLDFCFGFLAEEGVNSYICKRANIRFIVKRDIRDPLEVFEMRDVAPFDVLINASGIGFGDHDVFITTGKSQYIRSYLNTQ